MRVGILSMQRICNYGSFMQAFSLKKMIEFLGHEAVFIDFVPGRPLSSLRGGARQKVRYYTALAKETALLLGERPPFYSASAVRERTDCSGVRSGMRSACGEITGGNIFPSSALTGTFRRIYRSMCS